MMYLHSRALETPCMRTSSFSTKTGSRSYFNRTRQQTGLERKAALVKAALQQLRITRRDAAAVEAFEPLPFLVGRDRDRETAAAKLEAAKHAVFRVLTLASAGEHRFLEHVLADDAQIHDAVHDEARNVVGAHAKNFDGHVLRHGQQALCVIADLESAAFKKILRVVGEAPRLLHCNPQTIGFGHLLP